MKFTQRLAYYLSGFAIGLVILVFFLNGKEASCSYGPNARTIKNISAKPLAFSDEALQFMTKNTIDSTVVKQLIQYGTVDFSKSNTKLTSCKLYCINNTYKQRDIELIIENCNAKAQIKTLSYTNK